MNTPTSHRTSVARGVGRTLFATCFWPRDGAMTARTSAQTRFAAWQGKHSLHPILYRSKIHARATHVKDSDPSKHCTVISANNFSALSWIISRISPVQSAVSVRKSTLYRPFIFPILITSPSGIAQASALARAGVLKN